MIERATRMGELPKPTMSRRGNGQMVRPVRSHQKAKRGRAGWRITRSRSERWRRQPVAVLAEKAEWLAEGAGRKRGGTPGTLHGASECYPFRPCRADVCPVCGGVLRTKRFYHVVHLDKYVLSFACAAYASLPHL